jgi:hypothetical protein
MAKPAKRCRARKTAKVRPHAPRAAGGEPVEQPFEPFPGDGAGDEAGQDAWLLEREAEDVQRDGR